MTKSITSKAKSTAAAKKTAPAKSSKKPTARNVSVEQMLGIGKDISASKNAPAKMDRTFHATAILAAQAAKDTPKSAVLRTPSGFYTGSKRAGVKAGAEFVGRVATVLAAKKAKQQPAA